MRSPEDVTLRRLLNFSLGPALKAGFEQIFAAPLMVECAFAEVGAAPTDDVLARVNFDGTYRFEPGLTVVHTDPADEAAAAAWLRQEVAEGSSLRETVGLALAAWGALTAGKPFAAPQPASSPGLAGRTLEAALLDRRGIARCKFSASRRLSASSVEMSSGQP